MKLIIDPDMKDGEIFMYDRSKIRTHTIYCHEKIKNGYSIKSKTYMWVKK